MNLLRFLKSTQGKIKPLNALVISAAAGLAFAYVTNSQAQRQIAAKRATRSITSINATAPQASLRNTRGQLTSINVKDALNQVATAEERAAMGQNSALEKYVKNQQAMANMDAALGRAAGLFAGEEGLNTGNKDVNTATRMAVGNPNADPSGNEVTAAYRRRLQGAGNGGGEGNGTPRASFQHASMTRAAGSGANNTSGSAAGASGQLGVSGGEGQRLSGAMPQGTNIVSQMGLNGALAQGGRASFGRDRDGRVGRGQQTRGSGNELRDILKRSAKAAANPNASGNEGGTAFLSQTRSSGGIEVGAGEEPGDNATSPDLESNTNHKLQAIGDRLKQEEQTQENRQRENRNLLIQLLATVVGSIAMMAIAANVLPKMQGWWRWIVAGAMMAVVAAANAILFTKALDFINEYGSSGSGIAKLALIFSPVMVAGIVYACITPEGWKAMWQKVWSGFKRQFNLTGIATSQIMNEVNK